MTIRLYGSWLSPFARKVALALELKALPYDYVDGLLAENRTELHKLNPRGEVPVLVDDGVTVINSSDILQYLEWRHPEPALYPPAAADRIAVRTLERLADSRLDPIIVDTSFWRWAEREDEPPAGLMAAAQRDLDAVLDRLEQALALRPKPWPFGAPGVLECAWFPNLVAVRPMGFAFDAARCPSVAAWLRAMRTHPIFAADAKRTGAFLKGLKDHVGRAAKTVLERRAHRVAAGARFPRVAVRRDRGRPCHVSQSMIPKRPAPHLMRGGYRFSKKSVLQQYELVPAG